MVRNPEDKFSRDAAHVCFLFLQKTCEPVMCCYKLVSTKFKWFGLQGRVENFIIKVSITVKFLNFRTLENFAVIYLKFKQRDQTLGYFVKKMQIE